MYQVKKTITGDEPISLEEVKKYLKVDYSDDDSLISLLISGVREAVEVATGLSLIASEIEYMDDEIDESIRLPFPAHDEITEVKINGVASTAYTKTGLVQFIIYPNSVYTSMGIEDKGIHIKYTSSGACPEGLKLAMLKEIDEQYRNRGNSFEGNITGLSNNTWVAIAKYCL